MTPMGGPRRRGWKYIALVSLEGHLAIVAYVGTPAPYIRILWGAPILSTYLFKSSTFDGAVVAFSKDVLEGIIQP